MLGALSTLVCGLLEVTTQLIALQYQIQCLGFSRFSGCHLRRSRPSNGSTTTFRLEVMLCRKYMTAMTWSYDHYCLLLKVGSAGRSIPDCYVDRFSLTERTLRSRNHDRCGDGHMYHDLIVCAAEGWWCRGARLSL